MTLIVVGKCPVHEEDGAAEQMDAAVTYLARQISVTEDAPVRRSASGS
jgi:hypothetical protein